MSKGEYAQRAIQKNYKELPLNPVSTCVPRGKPHKVLGKRGYKGFLNSIGFKTKKAVKKSLPSRD
jgi:hypothetical protein